MNIKLNLTQQTHFLSKMEEEEPIICNEEVCEEAYVGCCNDGLCEHTIEFMCSTCAIWIEEDKVWLCDLCVKANSNRFK